MPSQRGFNKNVLEQGYCVREDTPIARHFFEEFFCLKGPFSLSSSVRDTHATHAHPHPRAAYAAFDTPPVFTTLERQRFFDLSPRLAHLLGTFRTPTNQLCFVLTLGYFKATNRFFARQFHDTYAVYVARQLGVLPGMFDLRAYEDTTARRHRQIILEHLGFQAFEEPAKQHLLNEIHSLIRSQARPKAIFLHALDTLARRKTEIPSAYLLTG